MKHISVERFSLVDTIECGQTFTWIRENEGYVNTDFGQVIYVEQRENTLFYETSRSDSVPLKEMFRLDDPLDEIQREIRRDGVMHESIAFAPNLRIINDPFFPCLISFICSTCKNIPAIHRMMSNIRRRYGPEYTFRGKTFYGFPMPEHLAEASIRDLERLELGYRAKYVKQTADSIVNGIVSENELKKMTYSEAHRTLKSLHGVGDKVADCVCLFSLGFLEAFPIDVWIERVIQEHYGIFTKTGKAYARKSAAAREYFGRYGGYAQEYLYNYTRSQGRFREC
ncbi:MAG: DNA-3-methyladenine glycosylase family protein [Candidatus Odinarchaeota archaeon]